MNRSLLTFLTFLLLLAGGAGLLIWWVGPAMVSLALDDERRSAPYYLVHLLERPDNSGYFQRFGQLLREEEAQLLWRGTLQGLHSGRSRDEMADVALLEFQAGAGVVRMMTSSAYRSLTEPVQPVLLGSARPPGPIAQDESLVLWLLETVEGADLAVLDGLGDSAGDYGGQLIWSERVDVLEGDRPWNRALLIAFPDAAAVTAWLADPGTATDRALARRQYVTDAMLELQSG